MGSNPLRKLQDWRHGEAGMYAANGGKEPLCPSWSRPAKKNTFCEREVGHPGRHRATVRGRKVEWA
jgi:hypothetical protein